MTDRAAREAIAKWDAQVALQDVVKMRSELDVPSAELTRRILDEAGPASARSIVDLALWSDNERVRLQAAQYIVNRQLGVPNDVPDNMKGGAAGNQPLEDLLGEVVSTAEDFVRQAGGKP